jgi:hypothetical protein
MAIAGWSNFHEIHHPLTQKLITERPDPMLIGEPVQIVYPGSANGINH